MYRSDPQTKSMLTHLFHRTIPDVARHHNLSTDLHSICDRLQWKHEPDIRLVPVAPARQATMASGPLITRLCPKAPQLPQEVDHSTLQSSLDNPLRRIS